MGFKKQSELRRAENEVVFRNYNKSLKRQVDAMLSHDDKADFLVGFMCECSDENCRQRIELPVNRFQQFSPSKTMFILAPGHQQNDIERVLEMFDGYIVVEKFEVPPTTDGQLNRTDANNAGTR